MASFQAGPLGGDVVKSHSMESDHASCHERLSRGHADLGPGHDTGVTKL